MLKFKFNKKFTAIVFLALLIVVSSSSLEGVLAENVNGGNVVVAEGETLEKTSFLSGNNVRIDGDINGTTFVTAGEVEINGTIDGDLFVACQNLTMNSVVKGSVFVASQNVTINGIAENNIYLAGNILKVKSQTNGSAFLVGQNIYIEEGSVIEKDAFAGASNVYQNGVINGDLSSASESLFIAGKIAGDLNYSSQDKADISETSEILGKTNWKEIEADPEPSKTFLSTLVFFKVFLSILAALLIWISIRLLRPKFWTKLAEKISISPLKTLGWGALTLILAPIVFILLMITVIGIPLSLILLALYIITIYISKIILSVFIGYWFQKRYNLSEIKTFGLLLLGLIVLSFLGKIPIMGWIFSFIIASFGLGSIILSARKQKTKIE